MVGIRLPEQGWDERDSCWMKYKGHRNAEKELSENAGLNSGRQRELWEKAAASQLLCSLQQLCAGVSAYFFPDYGILL